MIWSAAPLRDVSKVVTGNTPPKVDTDNYGDDVPWVKPPELGSTVPITDTAEMLSAKGASLARVLPKDAVLVSCIGSIGRVGIAGLDLATNQQINAVICGPSLVPRFVMYWLMNSTELLSKLANSAILPILNKGNFERIPVPIWPRSEQNRIVELLDEADRLHRLSREANTKTERILPALFLTMFGDPETNPKQWTPSTVGQVIVATDYGTSTKASDDGEGLPMIRMGNVDYAGNLDLRDLKYVCLPDKEVSKFGLERGDLLFNRTNSIDLVGKTGLWNVDMKAVLASYFIRVRVNREQVEPEFLWVYMNSAFMKRVLRATARGAIGQANINTTEIRSLPLNRPPLSIQKDFVGKLEAIRRAIPAAEVSAKLEGLFSLLLSRAFSGQLTAKWREAHMKELLAEMEVQARQLNLPMPQEATV
jgi:type I restriction enzyme, S subunit